MTLLKAKGAKLIGVADMDEFAVDGMNRGVAVAIPVPAYIVENIRCEGMPRKCDCWYELDSWNAARGNTPRTCM